MNLTGAGGSGSLCRRPPPINFPTMPSPFNSPK